MQRSSAPADAQRLLERMYDALDRPKLDRRELRECTDEIATLTMVRVEPEVSDVVVSFMDRSMRGQGAKLIALLLSKPGKTFSTDQCHSVLDVDGKHYASINRLRVVVSQTRTKLQRERIPYWIESVWGLGYRVVPRDVTRPASNGNGGRMCFSRQRSWAELEKVHG